MKASKKKSITVTVPVPQNMKTSERIPNHVLHKNEVLEIDDVNSKYDSDDQRILKILMAKCKVNMKIIQSCCLSICQYLQMTKDAIQEAHDNFLLHNPNGELSKDDFLKEFEVHFIKAQSLKCVQNYFVLRIP